MTVAVIHRQKTAVFIQAKMRQRGRILTGVISPFVYFYLFDLMIVRVYFSTVKMFLHTWAFWATQLNVVSKTSWLLTDFKCILMDNISLQITQK